MRPEQLARVLLMMMYAMCAYGGATVIGGAISSALFLGRLPPDHVPYRYPLTAVGIVLATTLYRRVDGVFRRDRVILLVSTVSLLCLLAFRYAIERYPTSFALLSVLVVFNDASEVLVSIQVWNLASEVFDGREAKRFFGLVAGGAVLSYIVMGSVVRVAVRAAGAPNLLLVYAGSVVCAMVCVALLGRRDAKRLDACRALGPAAPGAARGLRSDLRRLSRSPLLVVIGTLLAVKLACALIVDCQMSITLKQSFDEPGIAAYCATLSIWAGLAACVIQFLLAGRLIERFGMLTAILLLPCVMVIGMCAVMITHGSLWAVTLSRAANPVFGWLFSSTLGLFYVPVPGDFRPRARALNEGVMAPVAVGAAGLFVVALLSFGVSVAEISAVVLGALALQIVFSIRARRRYLESLAATLQGRRPDFDRSSLLIADPRTREVLSTSLRSDDVERVLSVLDIVESLGGGSEWDAEVAPLVVHPSPWVRLRALRHLARTGSSRWRSSVLRCLEDPEPEVLAEAIRSCCAMEGEDVSFTVRPFLLHENVLVRRAAVSGLFRHGGAAGALLAGRELQRMLASRDSVARAEGARLIGSLASSLFVESLPMLLEDESLEVQRAAIEAAGATRSRALLPLLVARLRDGRTEARAARAIAELGPGIEPELEAILSAGGESLAVRARVLHVLSLLGTQRAANVLVENLDQEDDDHRGAAALGLARLKGPRPSMRLDRSRVERVLLEEGRRALQWLVIQDDIGVASGISLLADVLRGRRRRCEDRIFHLLGTLYPLKTVRLIEHTLRAGGGQTENALELLDNLLSHDLKRALLPLLEGGAARDGRMKTPQATAIAPRIPDDVVDVLLASRDEWVRASTIHHVGALSLVRHAPAVRRALQDETSEITRETAGWALAKLFPTEASVPSAEKRGERVGGPSPSTIELVVYLRDVDLFSGLQVEALAAVARITSTVSFARGDLLMRQGELGHDLFLIASGEARVLVDDRELRRVGRLDCLGELSILDAEPRSASVVADTEVTVLRIERADFLDLLAGNAEMLRGLVRVLVSRLRSQPPLPGELQRPHAG